MEAATSLFRVFDIAFFLPGAVLFLDLWLLGLIRDCQDRSLRGNVVDALGALVLVYALGLLAHGCARGVRELNQEIRNKNEPTRAGADTTKATGKERWQNPAWYRALDATGRDRLLCYFWYLRGVCWNLAVTGPFTGYAVADYRMHGDVSMRVLSILSGTIAAAVLVWLGSDFERALKSLADSAAHARQGEPESAQGAAAGAGGLGGAPASSAVGREDASLANNVG